MSKSVRSLDIALIKATLQIVEKREGNFRVLFACRHALGLMITKQKNLYSNLDPRSRRLLEAATKAALDRTWVDEMHIVQMVEVAIIGMNDIRHCASDTHCQIKRFLACLSGPIHPVAQQPMLRRLVPA